MVRVTFVDVHGVEQAVAGEGDLSLMELAKANGIDGIAADCGGACSCATCLVHVDPAWVDRTGAPDDVEYAMLDMVSDVACLLYTSPSPRDRTRSRMPSSA